MRGAGGDLCGENCSAGKIQRAERGPYENQGLIQPNEHLLNACYVTGTGADTQLKTEFLYQLGLFMLQVTES